MSSIFASIVNPFFIKALYPFSVSIFNASIAFLNCSGVSYVLVPILNLLNWEPSNLLSCKGSIDSTGFSESFLVKASSDISLLIAFIKSPKTSLLFRLEVKFDLASFSLIILAITSASTLSPKVSWASLFADKTSLTDLALDSSILPSFCILLIKFIIWVSDASLYVAKKSGSVKSSINWFLLLLLVSKAIFIAAAEPWLPNAPPASAVISLKSNSVLPVPKAISLAWAKVSPIASPVGSRTALSATNNPPAFKAPVFVIT